MNVSLSHQLTKTDTETLSIMKVSSEATEGKSSGLAAQGILCCMSDFTGPKEGEAASLTVVLKKSRSHQEQGRCVRQDEVR